MGFVPGYPNDIFISYAHFDNDPLIGGKLGWVDFFEDLLRKRLTGRLGKKIEIFRDPKLRHYGKFSKQLAETLSSSAVFICIISPRYVESDWCLHELSEFGKRLSNDRVIKVVKTAVDEESYNEEAKSLFGAIKEILEFRFYETDERTGRFVDLQPEIIKDDIPVFVRKIDVIAQEVVELLKKLRKEASQPAIASKTQVEGMIEILDRELVPVYLAETTQDLSPSREAIRSELGQLNCRVLPDKPLPQTATDLINAARKHLQQAKLSVHLLGAHYGVRPESEDRSVPHIQYDLATEISGDNQLIQIVWMPDGLTQLEAHQQEFVNSIKHKAPEFLRSKLEDLKTEIEKLIKPKVATGWENEVGDPVNVCLFCHQEDFNAIKPLHTHLKLHEQFKVKLPLQEPSFQHHKELLQASDAVLLYYGTGDEDWFVNVWRLIQRHVSAGRTKPILAKGIYAGKPPTTEKDLLESDELVIMRNYDDFTPESLAPFTSKIRASMGGFV